jgi:hypothetical protein
MDTPAVVTDLASQPVRGAGARPGSVLVAPVRTDALWATLEVWSDFREAFNPQDAADREDLLRSREEDPRHVGRQRTPRRHEGTEGNGC